MKFLIPLILLIATAQANGSTADSLYLPPRFIDPYQRQKYSLPHLVAAFQFPKETRRDFVQD